ncbi:MAG: MBL fold metallo-hydrolase [Promethearchaeota archaeon]|nr:MAG: MBL fold metallo-hydrolase [Candidatus Lokiarchaeota archaeon]
MVIQIVKHENGKIIEWKWASDNKLIPTPFFTSVYFIDGIIIDSGAPASANDFRDFITSLLQSNPIKLCVITHTHEDHCGGAYILQKEFNIPIYAHKDAIEKLKKEYYYPEYRQIAWGEKRLSVDAEKLSDSITSNSEKFVFEIFPMSGHAPELITLIEKNQQWVFATDAIQPKYKMLFGAASDIQEDIAVIYDSMKKLYEYTANWDNLKIFLASSGVFEGKILLEEKLNEINSLHRKVHAIYEEESKNLDNEEKLLKRVLKRTFKRETAVGSLTQGDLSIMNLIKSLLKWPLSD